jgi:tetratricopeptide (TPR) repeat protein
MSGNGLDRLRRAYASLGESASFGATCPDAGRVWDAITGAASSADARAIVLHAASCGACAIALRLAREIAAGMPSGAKDVPESRTWVPRAALIAASLLIIALGAWLVSTSEPPRRIGSVTIAKAAHPLAGKDEELVWRGEESEAREMFDRAMRAYDEDDFSRSSALLARSLELEPDHADARFYLGVSLLLLGRAGEAIPALDAAARGSAGALHDEARWYLALAAVRAGDRDRARRVLDELIADGGGRRADARKLRKDLEDRR